MPLSRKVRMRNFIFGILFFATVVASTSTYADSPLAPPAIMSATSPDGSITAISDPAKSITKIEKTKTKKVLWQIPGWHRWLFVANDGKHAVTGYGGMNLIPQSYDKKMILISFWREGKKLRDVSLEEIITKKSMLEKTVSHYHWGGIEKIDEKGRLVVKRADEKVLFYDVATGLQIQ